MSLIVPQVQNMEIFAKQFCSGYMTWGINRNGTVKEEMNADDGGTVTVTAYGVEYEIGLNDEGKENEATVCLRETLTSHGWTKKAIDKTLIKLGVDENDF